MPVWIVIFGWKKESNKVIPMDEALASSEDDGC
jgi:hypothetical protein